MSLRDLLNGPQFMRKQSEKETLLLSELIALTRHHMERCNIYRKIVQLMAPEFDQARSIEDLPYLPASLFKSHHLQSVSDEHIRAVLSSSGTTGPQRSRIVIDDETATLQGKALVAVMREAFGSRRLPLLLLDSESTLSKPDTLSARSAGLLGFMTFGHPTLFALDGHGHLRKEAIADFLIHYGDAPFLIFGFTFMAWTALRDAAFDLRQGTLVHGGGWKKLEAEAVDNAQFRTHLQQQTGLLKIFNFYGMVEQTGTALLEGEDHLLYPPAFGDVVIRDPRTWEPLPPGAVGIVQMLSLIPRSYPGHSIVTEDLGTIVYVDKGAGGRMGKAVRILGRVPRAELRGCSDVHIFKAAA